MQKSKRRKQNRKKKETNTFKIISFKMAVLTIIASLNWISLFSIGQTLAYLNDTEESTSNIFTASILDFELRSISDFTPTPIKLGESTTRTIDLLNYGNEHKYKVSAINLSGDICNYLKLDANLNNGQVTYSGLLTDFVDFGPTVYSDPSSWVFTLTLPSDAPESILGQTCLFDFTFFGSQTRNDLAFGDGFKDTEELGNNIKTLNCKNIEIRSQGYWKNHSEVYLPYLPQTLGGYPADIIVSSVAEADTIFDNHSSLMQDILRIQLLAMKFNIAHFLLGDYYVQSEGKTINELVTYADNLLREPPSDPVNPELERVKDILDDLNTAEYLNHCYELLPPAPMLMMSSSAPSDENEEENTFFNEEPLFMITMLNEEENNEEEPIQEEENTEEQAPLEEPQQTEENQDQITEEPQENENPEQEPEISMPQGDIITENNNEELPQEEPAKLPEENPEEPQQIEENNNTQETNSGGGETTSEPIIENNEVTE
ncbi:MAG TPA: SipW-dependent-type signal peptide-containing protein [Candidatus Pacearchaeota archaeon]|nr:SipW-dependent-type signal peptide-containing protein [Candidatus Pacearchaeota archaeon]